MRKTVDGDAKKKNKTNNTHQNPVLANWGGGAEGKVTNTTRGGDKFIKTCTKKKESAYKIEIKTKSIVGVDEIAGIYKKKKKNIINIYQKNRTMLVAVAELADGAKSVQ